MSRKAISAKIERMRAFYNSGQTRGVGFRKKQLALLRDAIRANEEAITAALRADLGKPYFESYAGEIGILYPEIKHSIGHVASWARKKRVKTPIIHFLSKSVVYHEPYGVSLIIGPWNYPFHLVIAPLIPAIAAGNCAVIKPSEFSPATSQLIAKIIGETFPEEYITVVQGGVPETGHLLENRFDYIFFTGGPGVGKIVMTAAARNLTPVTLELGGKSPVIVDRDAKLGVAARRICWGKFFNAGQTCLAPDYVLVHEEVKGALIAEMKRTLREFYGDDPRRSPDYARIITPRHFDRLRELLDGVSVVHGGESDRKEKYIAPTLVDGVTGKDRVMREEIFGPILPVTTFRSLDEAIARVNGMPRPLALYCFSESKQSHKKVLAGTISGGGCVNDTFSHVGSQHLPFGGIGDSGMGRYHGRSGFETFSHQRGILHRSTRIDLSLRYPPYGNKARLLKFIFRLLG